MLLNDLFLHEISEALLISNIFRIFVHKTRLMEVKPNISKRVFWDVDFDSLDYEKDKLFIIDKVMNYGLWDDFLAVLRYYGKEIIKKEIVKSPYLKKDILNFLCFYLDLKPQQFRCYNRRRLQEPHWNF